MTYLGLRVIQLRDEYEEWEREKKRRKREQEMCGAVAYAVPALMEYVVFPPKDIPRLKAYIRSTAFPHEVLRKAGKKGFSLYFQLFRRPFTSGENCGILYNPTERTMENRPITYCRQYDQMIHPALCIARSIIYPKEMPASPYYLEMKEKLKEATTKQEKKRLRREVKKHSPIFDPYPKCRSCIMSRKLVQKSCLGAEFDLEDEECTNCPSRKECCQLMRLRIESILEGDEEEVKKDILKEWKRLVQKRKEVKEEMAKKKRKAEDVTEEVVEETEAPEKRGKKKKGKKEEAPEGATKTKAQLRAEKRKKARQEAKAEEGKAEKKGKKKKKSDEGSGVKKLLKQLQEAKDEGDQGAARKIRAELRAAGYSLRDQMKK